MVYKIIYSFEVYGKIKEGKNVYYLDREDQYTALLNEYAVKDFISIMNHADECKNENRYEFWIEENTEEVRE